MLLVRPKLLQCAKDNNVSDEQLKAIIANDLTNQGPEIQVSFFFYPFCSKVEINFEIIYSVYPSVS